MTVPHSNPPEMRWGSAPELVGPRHAYRVRRIADCLAEALQHGHVLDAGCGAGALTELLARRGYQVTAVDDSNEFVCHALARLQRAGLTPQVHVEQQDLQTLDFPEAAFDAVVCGEVLEHLADDRGATRRLARVLRPGGVMVLTVPAGPEQYDWLDRWAGHQRRYDEEGLRDLLVQSGLEIERLIHWGFPCMALYERFIQRPGLAHTGRPGRQGSMLARLARWAPVGTVFGACFAVDRIFEGRTKNGTGLLARARRPK